MDRNLSVIVILEMLLGKKNHESFLSTPVLCSSDCSGPSIHETVYLYIGMNDPCVSVCSMLWLILCLGPSDIMITTSFMFSPGPRV